MYIGKKKSKILAGNIYYLKSRLHLFDARASISSTATTRITLNGIKELFEAICNIENTIFPDGKGYLVKK